MMKLILASALAMLLPAFAAVAAPSLKADITVHGAVVTVGDMFDDAGAMAGTALFRAPALGTSGDVTVADVRQAAALAGFSGYDVGTLAAVTVSRPSTTIDAAALSALLADTLRRRGVLSGDMVLDARFDIGSPVFTADATPAPASLTDLRYGANGASPPASRSPARPGRSTSPAGCSCWCRRRG
jgi:flagella basal body P-ring formation protein FlgA